MFFSHGFGGRILLWKWHGCKSSSWNEKMICECIYKKRRVFQCHTTLACTKNEERPKIAPVGVNQCRKPMVVISITHVHPLQIVDKYDWEMSTSTEAASPVASSRAGATTRRIHLNSSVRNSHHPVILQAKEILDLRTSWLECLNHSRLGYEGIDMFWWPNKMNKMNKEPKPFQTRAFSGCIFHCCVVIKDKITRPYLPEEQVLLNDSWTCLLYDIIFISILFQHISPLISH